MREWVDALMRRCGGVREIGEIRREFGNRCGVEFRELWDQRSVQDIFYLIW